VGILQKEGKTQIGKSIFGDICMSRIEKIHESTKAIKNKKDFIDKNEKKTPAIKAVIMLKRNSLFKPWDDCFNIKFLLATIPNFSLEKVLLLMHAIVEFY